MAGEHILKLLKETTATINFGNRYLTRTWSGIFTVYEESPEQTHQELIQTEDEEEACRILKGE